MKDNEIYMNEILIC